MDVEPLFPHEGRPPEGPGQVEAQDDDDHPTDPGDPTLVDTQELPQERGRSPQDEEDPGEPRHEKERMDERGTPIYTFLEILQGHPGDEAQVAGNQGQDTGGQEVLGSMGVDRFVLVDDQLYDSARTMLDAVGDFR